MNQRLLLSLLLLIAMSDIMSSSQSYAFFYKSNPFKTLLYPFRTFWNSSRSTKALVGLGAVGALLLFHKRWSNQSTPPIHPQPKTQTTASERNKDLNELQSKIQVFEQNALHIENVNSKILLDNLEEETLKGIQEIQKNLTTEISNLITKLDEYLPPRNTKKQPDDELLKYIEFRTTLANEIVRFKVMTGEKGAELKKIIVDI